MEAEFIDDMPIEEVEPRLRLGTLVRRARMAAGMKLNRVADDLGITNVMLGQVERGLVPFSVDQMKAFALLTMCEYAPLFEASRAFHVSIWDGSPPGSSVTFIGGDEKTFIAEEEETLDE